MLPIWIGHFVQDGLDSSIKWTGGPYFKSQFSVMSAIIAPFIRRGRAGTEFLF